MHMRNVFSAVPRTVSAAAFLAGLLALGTLAGVTPAAAANSMEDQIISNFCNGHPDASECGDWQYNRAGWSDEQYQAFYRSHQNEDGFNNAQAAGAFGYQSYDQAQNDQAATSQPVMVPSTDNSDSNWQVGQQRGNVVGDQPEVIGDSPTHVADCMATFKSYNVSTDTYVGLDGATQRCKL